MPDGSSSDAPVISQGPMALRYRRHLALVLKVVRRYRLGLASSWVVFSRVTTGDRVSGIKDL